MRLATIDDLMSDSSVADMYRALESEHESLRHWITQKMGTEIELMDEAGKVVINLRTPGLKIIAAMYKSSVATGAFY